MYKITEGGKLNVINEQCDRGRHLSVAIHVQINRWWLKLSVVLNEQCNRGK